MHVYLNFNRKLNCLASLLANELNYSIYKIGVNNESDLTTLF